MTTQKNLYPEIIEAKKSNKYKIVYFDGSTYEEEYKKAYAYVKENGGAVYTIIDGWGSSVDYFKGVCSCDRLGVCVLLHNTQIKRSGNKRIGLKQSRLNGSAPHRTLKDLKGGINE